MKYPGLLLHVLPELRQLALVSGKSATKLTIFGSGRWVLGFRLCERFIDGNLIGSRTKKVGYRHRQWLASLLPRDHPKTRTVLLNTQSRFPSSVYSFIPHPCTSREVSAEPLSGPTVETRSRTSVFLPTVFRKLADVMSVQSLLHSKEPYALGIISTRYTEGPECSWRVCTRLLWRAPLCIELLVSDLL